MDIEYALSSRFRNMSIMCAFLVVVIHCTSNFNVSNCFVRMFIYDGVCRIAVPFFFFASGFFLAAHFGENYWWGKEIAKRIRTLFVPYLICVTLYMGDNLMLWCLMPPLVFASCVGVILLQRRFSPGLNVILWGGR